MKALAYLRDRCGNCGTYPGTVLRTSKTTPEKVSTLPSLPARHHVLLLRLGHLLSLRHVALAREDSLRTVAMKQPVHRSVTDNYYPTPASLRGGILALVLTPALSEALSSIEIPRFRDSVYGLNGTITILQKRDPASSILP